MEMLESIWLIIVNYYGICWVLVRAAFPYDLPPLVESAVVVAFIASTASAAILGAVFAIRMLQRRSQRTPDPFSESSTFDRSLPPSEPHKVRGRVYKILPPSALPRRSVEAAMRSKR